MNPNIPILVNNYIQQFDAFYASKLLELHGCLAEVLTNIPVDIGYKMPVFRMKGHSVYYAGYKNHIGLYPGSKPIEVFKQELAPFKTSKGAIQLLWNEELPKDLIQSIAVYNLDLFRGKQA